MKTAIELADEFPEQNLANIEPDAAYLLNGWGLEAVAMLCQQAEQIEALKAALKDAATSLDTISRLAGREFYAGEGGERVETYMHHPDQIRGYAKSRHGVAIDAMKGKS